MKISEKIILGHLTQYVDSGSSGVPIFFIHGNSAGKEVFYPLINEYLGSRFRCISFDLLGCSNLEKENESGQLHFHQILEHMKLFIDSFNFEEYFVFGHSLGGHLYLENARFFKNAKGAFLCGVPPLGKTGVPLNPFQDNPVIPLLFNSELSEKNKIDLVENLINQNDDNKELIFSLLSRTNPLFRSALSKAHSDGLIIDEVAAIFESSIPICLSIGENDRLINHTYLEQFSEKIWKGKPLIIKSAGHYPQLENPGELSEFICEFVLEFVKKN